MNIARLFKSSLIAIVLAAGVVASCSIASAQFTHVGDVKIDGSLAIGLDTQSSTAFGFDTMRLRENNLRIHFDDTSTTASFPPNDWRIIINDSANGGSSHFTVQDATAGRNVFRVFAGARSNALVVDSQGDVGLGTTTPALDIDIKTGDTPSIRLQQDGTSGFTPQTWDVAGNETNFFIRDATHGSKLPFRIRPDADSNSLFINSNNDIGMGTASPDANLHIRETTSVADDAIFHIEQTNAAAEDVLTVLDNGKVGIGTDTPTLSQDHGGLHITNSNAGLRMQNSADGGWGYIEYYDEGGTGRFISGYHDSSQTYRAVAGTALSGSNGIIVTFGGNVGIRNTNAAFPLEVGTNGTNGNGAHVTTGGVWTNGSSREFKENIADISIAEAREAVMNLAPVKYNYRLEPDELYAGFIAEDVPELVATNSRKYLSPMDIVSVVTKVVQDQQETIDRLNKRIEQLEAAAQTQD